MDTQTAFLRDRVIHLIVRTWSGVVFVKSGISAWQLPSRRCVSNLETARQVASNLLTEMLQLPPCNDLRVRFTRANKRGSNQRTYHIYVEALYPQKVISEQMTLLAKDGVEISVIPYRHLQEGKIQVHQPHRAMLQRLKCMGPRPTRTGGGA